MMSVPAAPRFAVTTRRGLIRRIPPLSQGVAFWIRTVTPPRAVQPCLQRIRSDVARDD